MGGWRLEEAPSWGQKDAQEGGKRLKWSGNGQVSDNTCHLGKTRAHKEGREGGGQERIEGKAGIRAIDQIGSKNISLDIFNFFNGFRSDLGTERPSPGEWGHRPWKQACVRQTRHRGSHPPPFSPCSETPTPPSSTAVLFPSIKCHSEISLFLSQANNNFFTPILLAQGGGAL